MYALSKIDRKDYYAVGDKELAELDSPYFLNIKEARDFENMLGCKLADFVSKHFSKGGFSYVPTNTFLTFEKSNEQLLSSFHVDSDYLRINIPLEGVGTLYTHRSNIKPGEKFPDFGEVKDPRDVCYNTVGNAMLFFGSGAIEHPNTWHSAPIYRKEPFVRKGFFVHLFPVRND